MLNIPTKADGVDTLSATEFNSLNNELKNIIESTGQTLAGGDLFQMAKSAATYAGSGTFYTDSGSTNSYVLSAIDSFQTIDAYTDGLTIRFVATTENTGAATVNVNSLGAKSIVTSSGVALPSADIVIGDYITARYDVGNDNFLVEPDFSKISSNTGRNLIINGDFSVWQRGVSQTTDGYSSDDRWINGNNGSTKVHTQRTFTVGQTDVPDNPTFFSRTVATTSAGVANFVNKLQNIEDVRLLSGKTITLSFWAKADSAKDIAIEFLQAFGTGGSPSSSVSGIGVTTLSLTTSFTYHTVTVTLPSITGKTLGTDDNSFTRLTVWFDAGSSFDARSNTLGQQSGTFDISNVQLEFGTVASDFEFISPQKQLAACQRYFERISGDSVDQQALGFAFGNSTTAFRFPFYYLAKRDIPTVTGSSSAGDFETIPPGGGTIPCTFTTSIDQGITSSLIDITRDSGTHLVGDIFISRISIGTNNFVDIEAEL